MFAAGAAGFAAGWAGCCAGLAAPCSADFTLLGVDGLTCASAPGAAAAIMIPSPRVIAERIVRSFPFIVYPPLPPAPSLQQPELHQRQQAW